jgi:hypothetical protein
MTLKVKLILFPHVICNLISPLIGSSHFIWPHHIYPQFPGKCGMKAHFELKYLVTVQANLLGIVLVDKVVKCCKCRWNENLGMHAVLWWNLKDSKMSLEDPKDPLDDIAS